MRPVSAFLAVGTRKSEYIGGSAVPDRSAAAKKLWNSLGPVRYGLHGFWKTR